MADCQATGVRGYNGKDCDRYGAGEPERNTDAVHGAYLSISFDRIFL